MIVQPLNEIKSLEKKIEIINAGAQFIRRHLNNFEIAIIWRENNMI